MSIDSFRTTAALMGLEPSDELLKQAASRYKSAALKPIKKTDEAPEEALIMSEAAEPAVAPGAPAAAALGATIGISAEIAARKEINAIDPKRAGTREDLLTDDDPMGLERIINDSDLMPINYLEKGLVVAKSVARVVIRNKYQQVLGFGTGFLVSPTLFITNNHVIQDIETGGYCMFEFRVEYDINGRPTVPVVFESDPQTFFVTSKELDFTIIAVKPVSLDGTSLSDFGFNRLISSSGKALPKEYVSIIQHPQGMPKQVTVRENKVMAFENGDTAAAHFIHYHTDTEPGSSGSPVYNDQWNVVALHHSGVPQTDKDGNIVKDDRGNVIWIGNEGVRISSICSHLMENRETIGNFHLITEMINLGNTANPWSPLSPVPSAGGSEEAYTVATLEKADYSNATGYTPEFLGKDDLRVDLPKLTDAQIEDAAKLIDSPDEYILKYTNFSIIVNAKRKLAYFSACNIDGETHVSITRTKDVWYVDGRISKNEQSADIHYRDGRLGVDRGHITRREEPNWGPNAELGNRDTFHFTNCSPQFWEFNQRGWLTLEKYVLDTAKKNKMRVTVFTGPVLRPDDRPYRGLLVPADFWKIVVWNSNGTLKAAAYLHSQRNFLDELKEAYGPYKTYQRTVKFITDLTGLDFRSLIPLDINTEEEAPEAMESARPSYRVIETDDDLRNLLA